MMGESADYISIGVLIVLIALSLAPILLGRTRDGGDLEK
jgi:hypothetical protein